MRSFYQVEKYREKIHARIQLEPDRTDSFSVELSKTVAQRDASYSLNKDGEIQTWIEAEKFEDLETEAMRAQREFEDLVREIKKVKYYLDIIKETEERLKRKKE